MAADTASSSKVTSPPYFSTWSALQAHIRDAHPPTCLHLKCNRRTFNSQKNLKAHLKTHKEKGNDEQVQTDAGASPQRGRDVRRDWQCEEEGCIKSFKSVSDPQSPIQPTNIYLYPQKKALAGHANVHHYQRDFICEREGCGRAFGYKHTLQRHEAKVHRSSSPMALLEDIVADQPPSERNPAVHFIDEITGNSYKNRHVPIVQGRTGQTRQRTVLCCPWPYHTFLVEKVEGSMEEVVGVDVDGPCKYVFHRVYDLRRHLLSVHKLRVDKVVLEEWARGIHLDSS